MLKTIGQLSTAHRIKNKHLSLISKVPRHLIPSHVFCFISYHTCQRCTLLSFQNFSRVSQHKTLTHTALALHMLFLLIWIFSHFFFAGKTCLQFKTCIKCNLLWRASLDIHAIATFSSSSTKLCKYLHYFLHHWMPSLLICLPEVLLVGYRIWERCNRYTLRFYFCCLFVCLFLTRI